MKETEIKRKKQTSYFMYEYNQGRFMNPKRRKRIQKKKKKTKKKAVKKNGMGERSGI